MQIVLRESRRLNRIISEFLDYARPAPLRRQTVNVAELLDEVALLLERHPLAEKITIVRNYAAALPFRRVWGSLNGRWLVPPTRKGRLRFPTRPKSSKTVLMLMKKPLCPLFEYTARYCSESTVIFPVAPYPNTAWKYRVKREAGAA